MREILITKRSGIKEPYNEEIVRRSLERAGTPEETINIILEKIRKKLYNGIPTHKLRRIIHHYLKKKTPHIAGKYDLKQAIFHLGPEGYVFEQYSAKLLEAQGYETKTNLIIQGKCVNHEIDVTATNERENLLVECKFHNRKDIICRVQVPLYFYARFQDVKETNPEFTVPLLITNTRFSEDAIQYAKCIGVQLIGWKYPRENSIERIVDKTNTYPITIITSLTRRDQYTLLEKGIITIQDLQKTQHQELRKLPISWTRIENALHEVGKHK